MPIPGLLFCLIAFVQDPPPVLHPEIRGVVVDENQQPVADAEVSASTVPGTGTMGQYAAQMKESAAKTKTDASGKFSFHPDQLGNYLAWASKDGYQPDPSALSYGQFALSAKAPVKELRFVLVRTVEITGRVVDEDGNPLAKFPVAALKLSRLPGRTLNFPVVVANTDADGKFVIPKLQPGTYLVEIRPHASGTARVLKTVSDDDEQKIDEDWEHSFWPGGHSEDTASPLTIPSGATVDFGRLTARKVHYYRVHLRIPPSTCKPPETIKLAEFTDSYQLDIRHEDMGEIPCGRDVLVAGYRPGAYRLSLATGGDDPDTFGSASVPFLVTDKNLALTANLTPGLALDIAVATADGSKAPDYTKLSASAQAIGALMPNGSRRWQHPSADGKLRLTGLPTANHWLAFSGLAAGNTVKEIRYNGGLVANLSFRGSMVEALLPLEQGSMTHAVTIVLDDHPASLTGTVTDGDQPAGKPWLILAKWPPATTPYRVVSSVSAMGDESPEVWNATVASGDPKGQFQFSGLPAGEYRIVALRTRAEDENRTPGSLERALAAAPKIEISPGGLLNLSLAITQLR